MKEKNENKKNLQDIKVVRFDWAMKNLLRNKANFDVLEGFLSELLKTNVTILSLLESESNKDRDERKLNRVDLLADTSQGKVIIEVQVQRELDYLSRLLFGTSKIITDHLKKGENFYAIQKVYSVSILYFDLGEGDDYLYKGQTEFRGLHTQHILGLTEKEKSVYQHPVTGPADVFPEYYLIKVNQFRDRIQEKLDEWMYFFKHEAVKPDFTAQGLQSAGQKLAVLRMPEEDQRRYDSFLYDLSYENSMLHSHYTEGWVDRDTQAKQERKTFERKLDEKTRLILKAEEEKTALILKAEEEKKRMIQKMKEQGLSLEEIQAILG